MKNFIKVIFYLYIILIMPFMIYMYSTNHSISSKMQNNDMLRAKISSLDQFKESIIDMAIMSKYYLITGDQYYKTEFEKIIILHQII
ncbi:CHASE3 domain-containing protein [Clostridium butyricum]